MKFDLIKNNIQQTTIPLRASFSMYMLTKYLFIRASVTIDSFVTVMYIMVFFSIINYDTFTVSVLTATTQTYPTDLELQRRTAFTSPADNTDVDVINRWTDPPPEYSLSCPVERSRSNATERMYQTSQINAAESTYPSANYQRNPWFLRNTPNANLDPPPEYSVSCITGRTVPSESQDSRDPGVCHQTTESQCCDPPPSYDEAVNSSWYCYCSVHGNVSDSYARTNLVFRTRSKCSSFLTLYHIVPYLYLGVYVSALMHVF